MQEAFPHVFVDIANRVVELEGVVPILVDDPDAGPVVYLELIACIPDTKEHEVLVMTQALPSHVHAALLMIDLEPGAPGAWEWRNGELIAHPPTGDPVRVELVYTDARGRERVEPAWSWVSNLETGETFPAGDWVFAGSRIVEHMGREFYDADGTGTLIGLTTFGSETIAWPEMISHEAAIEEPVWIADPEKTPALDTPVTIRLTPGGRD
ncbi:MAG: hypothetical protein EA376_10845 [Phycisphaeraceae bacterium]|nr:MAG: hypothetical protein EA376_10845 [Phycisphaeraceae bacterium]